MLNLRSASSGRQPLETLFVFLMLLLPSAAVTTTATATTTTTSPSTSGRSAEIAPELGRASKVGSSSSGAGKRRAAEAEAKANKQMERTQNQCLDCNRSFGGRRRQANAFIFRSHPSRLDIDHFPSLYFPLELAELNRPQAILRCLRTQMRSERIHTKQEASFASCCLLATCCPPARSTTCCPSPIVVAPRCGLAELRRPIAGR